jgi:hypothetical protein
MAAPARIAPDGTAGTAICQLGGPGGVCTAMRAMRAPTARPGERGDEGFPPDHPPGLAAGTAEETDQGEFRLATGGGHQGGIEQGQRGEGDDQADEQPD